MFYPCILVGAHGMRRFVASARFGDRAIEEFGRILGACRAHAMRRFVASARFGDRVIEEFGRILGACRAHAMRPYSGDHCQEYLLMFKSLDSGLISTLCLKLIMVIGRTETFR